MIEKFYAVAKGDQSRTITTIEAFRARLKPEEDVLELLYNLCKGTREKERLLSKA